MPSKINRAAGLPGSFIEVDGSITSAQEKLSLSKK